MGLIGARNWISLVRIFHNTLHLARKKLQITYYYYFAIYLTIAYLSSLCSFGHFCLVFVPSKWLLQLMLTSYDMWCAKKMWFDFDSLDLNCLVLEWHLNPSNHRCTVSNMEELWVIRPVLLKRLQNFDLQQRYKPHKDGCYKL